MSDQGAYGKEKEAGDDRTGMGIEDNIPMSSSDGESDQEDEGGVGDSTDDSERTRRSSLECLASLESSLPMKMAGLFRHYDGKSKSLGNLNELGIEYAKDSAKKEHLVNKRLGLQIAGEIYHGKTRNKPLLGDTASASTVTHASSMPCLTSDHGHEEEEEEEEDNKGDHNKTQEEKEDGEDGKSTIL